MNRLLLPALGVGACSAQLLYEVTKAVLWMRAKHKNPANSVQGKIVVHSISLVGCLSVLLGTHSPTEDGAGDEVTRFDLARRDVT